jgi:hypothetical protein
MEMRLADDCLAVFVDDTGHEDLPHGHNVYGLGGCAVMAGDLEAIVRAPWRQVRRVVSGSTDTPLHATDLRNPSPEQIEAFTRFFSTWPFGRIAVTITTATKLHDDLSAVQTVVKALQLRIVDMAQWTPFSRVAVIVEESKRSSLLVARAFDGFGLYSYGLNRLVVRRAARLTARHMYRRTPRRKIDVRAGRDHHKA